MKVWVVWDMWDEKVVWVCSSEDAARGYVDEVERRGYDGCTYEAFEVDGLPKGAAE